MFCRVVWAMAKRCGKGCKVWSSSLYDVYLPSSTFSSQHFKVHRSYTVSEMSFGTKHRVIHKFVKHLKNTQQMDYETDRGNSYVDRERNCWSFFLRKSRRTLLPWFAARRHRCCGSGRPWYADTRVERNGLSHRCLPYYQMWKHWASVKYVKQTWRVSLSISVRNTMIRWVVYFLWIF